MTQILRMALRGLCSVRFATLNRPPRPRCS